jgi:hypothetical protein
VSQLGGDGFEPRVGSEHRASVLPGMDRRGPRAAVTTFDRMAGVPQIAADLLQRGSRQPWARSGLGANDSSKRLPSNLNCPYGARNPRSGDSPMSRRRTNSDCRFADGGRDRLVALLAYLKPSPNQESPLKYQVSCGRPRTRVRNEIRLHAKASGAIFISTSPAHAAGRGGSRR